MQIVTDNKRKPFKYRYEVSEKVLEDQFGYLNEEDSSDTFFKYRDYWYHLSDFMICPAGTDLAEWQGYSADTFFSGVVIKVVSEDEYIVGRYWS